MSLSTQYLPVGTHEGSVGMCLIREFQATGRCEILAEIER